MHLNVTPDTTLCSGTLTATLAPAAGGRVTSLSSRATAGERIDWLVPLDDAVRAGGFESTQWPKAGCYPLVPFSNRIRDGRIAGTQGRVQLPLHPGNGTRCMASASSVHGTSSGTQRTAPP